LEYVKHITNNIYLYLSQLIKEHNKDWKYGIPYIYISCIDKDYIPLYIEKSILWDRNVYKRKTAPVFVYGCRSPLKAENAIIPLMELRS